MLRPIRRALLSVSDKTGLIDFARDLVAKYGVELVATGGTKQALADASLPVTDVAALTNFPEILDGRVKTLHPAVFAGLLADRAKPDHMTTLAQQRLPEIDLVVCNLYPFEQTVSRPGATEQQIIETIDIGGPSMVRAAAKNYQAVAIVVSPTDYPRVLNELKQCGGQTRVQLRQQLAATAFARVADYDHAIREYFEELTGGLSDAVETMKGSFVPVFERHRSLRYGENPHQQAIFYRETPKPTHACVATAEPLHGKELSYNNIADLDAALNLAREFADPACVVVKHNNPCGAATASSLVAAFELAWAGDPQSAFGGILAFNRPIDAATADSLAGEQRFVECIIAPDFDDDAFVTLTTKPSWKKNVRLLRTGPLIGGPQGMDYRRVDGGLLVQSRDYGADDVSRWQTVTRAKPSDELLKSLWFAWLVCKQVKSNAIVLAKGTQVVGVGAGQMSRVDSTHIASWKAGERVNGSVLASDAFFPFRDNVDTAAKAGVAAVVQPGGSQRDAESIAACDEHGIPMLFTGVRHFKH